MEDPHKRQPMKGWEMWSKARGPPGSVARCDCDRRDCSCSNYASHSGSNNAHPESIQQAWSGTINTVASANLSTKMLMFLIFINFENGCVALFKEIMICFLDI